jgi:hypothetical protein
MADIVKEKLSEIARFRSLWERFGNTYLAEQPATAISTEKEDEFLKFKCYIMEHLCRIDDINNDKLFIHDDVASVLNECLSITRLHAKSGQSAGRVRNRWEEVFIKLDKLKTYCETHETLVEEQSKLARIKLQNPFWDPEVGGFKQVLFRLMADPFVFFEGLSIHNDAKESEHIRSFLFRIFAFPITLIMLVWILSHATQVYDLIFDITVKFNILNERTSLFSKILLVAIIGVLTILVSSIFSAILMGLTRSLSSFQHFFLRMFGAIKGRRMTMKITTYSLAPIMLVFTLPFSIFLQIVGACKAQNMSVGGGFFGWLLGTAGFFAALFAIVGVALYFTGDLAQTEKGEPFPEVGEIIRDIPKVAVSKVRSLLIQLAEKVSGSELEFEEE